MMTNTKWLRRALLGGVALSVMASGAQAGELAELKAQLEGLQSRVNQLEQQPTMAALPEGASYITLSRGSADVKTHVDRGMLNHNDTPETRGFTIAVTPTADLPAPVAEVVVYGFVKGDMIYTIDNDTGDALSVGALFSRRSDSLANNHINAHAKQTRFGIRARADTAIGQIRSQIEGDFFTGVQAPPSNLFRARHLFGEWDITPNWTFLAGQTTRAATLVPIGVPTVDFGYSAGTGGFPRAMQVRMTYHAGPISWAVSAERPSNVSAADWPNIAGYIQYDAPGGHQFIVTGGVSDRARRDLVLLTTTRDAAGVVTRPGITVRSRGGLGWTVGAGANVNLADIATLTVGAQYGEQLHCDYLIQTIGCNALLDAHHIGLAGFNNFFGDEGWGLTAGLQFNLTDTTQFNVQYGFTTSDNRLRARNFDARFADFRPARNVDVHTVHANVLWRPVQQMRLGWEVIWAQYNVRGGDRHLVFGGTRFDEDRSRSKDTLRAQFGAWFFF